jgi:hypothetical protein
MGSRAVARMKDYDQIIFRLIRRNTARVARWFLTVGRVLLVLCGMYIVVIGILWAVSYLAPAWRPWRLWGGTWAVATGPGQMAVGEFQVVEFPTSMDPMDLARVHVHGEAGWYAQASSYNHLLGDRFEGQVIYDAIYTRSRRIKGHAPRFGHLRIWFLSCHCLMSLALLPMTIAIGFTCIGVRVGNRSIPSGCCPTCGYDLRATPTRCPECGKQPMFSRISSHHCN